MRWDLHLHACAALCLNSRFRWIHWTEGGAAPAESSPPWPGTRPVVAPPVAKPARRRMDSSLGTMVDSTCSANVLSVRGDCAALPGACRT